MLLGGNRGANQPHYCDNRLKPGVFLPFYEAMQQSAVQMGFSEQDARTLVQSVALGAAKLVEANPTTPLSTLRENVTSKEAQRRKPLRCLSSTILLKPLMMQCGRQFIEPEKWSNRYDESFPVPMGGI